MDEAEFWRGVRGRLESMERTLAWLAKHTGVSAQRLDNYVHGRRRMPDDIKQRIIDQLDLRDTEPVAA